jgi:hypothetical protein
VCAVPCAPCPAVPTRQETCRRPAVCVISPARVTAQAEGGPISTPFDARVDQALQNRSRKRQSRIVSAAIIAIGLAVLAVVLLLSGGRKRARTAVQVMVGDDSIAVSRLLGAPPHRCPPSNLAHLTDQFPAQTPRPTIDEELDRLRRGTTQRWVYPRGEGCVPDDGATELGLDRAGRVLWIVPARDKQPLRYEVAPT